MSNILKYGTASFVIFFALIIIICIRKNKLNLKYALVWLAILFAMLVAILVPNFLEFMADLIGFEVISNMIFLFAIIFLLLICFSLTIIVSKQKNMIRLLVQEVSMLKSKKGDE